MRPDRLELGAVGQAFAHLDGRVGSGVGSLGKQRALLQPRDDLPLHDAALFQPLGSVLPDDVLLLGDELADRLEELSHWCPSRAPPCGLHNTTANHEQVLLYEFGQAVTALAGPVQEPATAT